VFLLRLNFLSCLDSKKGKPGSTKAAKGSIASSNAYMLVYCRRDVAAVKSADRNGKHLEDESILPPWVRSSLQEENDTFNTWSSDVVNRKVIFFNYGFNSSCCIMSSSLT
jgi:ubiquitin carboxyl-terminal hydrolase 48